MGMDMTAALKDWDFSDESANGTGGLINRQKSAGTLVVMALDIKRRTGCFLDRERKTQSVTSLSSCDCRDFGFVGKSPRKTSQPCRHIYRLAMELGLLELRYLDHEAREALRVPRRPARELLAKLRPVLRAFSANVSDGPPPRSRASASPHHTPGN